MDNYGLCVKLMKDNRVIGARGFKGDVEFSQILKYADEFVKFYLDVLSSYPLSERYFVIHFYHMTLSNVSTWKSHYELMDESLRYFDLLADTKSFLAEKSTLDPSSVIGLTTNDMMSIILNSKKIVTIDVDERVVKLDASMFIYFYIADYKKHFNITDNDFNIEMFPIIETKVGKIPFKDAHRILHEMSVNLQGFRSSEKDKKILVPID